MREPRSIRRVLLWFAVGLVVAAAAAEGSARIAEAAGPPVLRWYDAATQLKVEQMDRAGGAAVVFAGTSMAWQGLMPSEFAAADPGDRTAYNAGLAGGVPIVMEPWLLEEVVPRLQPDLIVWGLSSMDFSSSYGDDNLERYRDALDTRTGRLATLEQTTSRFSALVRYRTILRRPSAMFGSGRDEIETEFEDAASTLGDSGERRDFTVNFGDKRSSQVESRFRNFRIDETDIQAIHRTVTNLREQGIEVVLVEMPTPDAYAALHPGGDADLARTHQTIVAIGEVFDLAVVDLRFGFAESSFVDFTHLGEQASRDLTIRLANSLPDSSTAGTPPQQSPTDRTSPDSAIPLIESTSRAFRIVESLFHPLTGGGEDWGTPGHWYGRWGYVHGWNAEWHTVIGNEFEVVLLGSSQMLWAGDPRVFAELDGRTAYNASLPGTEPEEQRLWLEAFVLKEMTPSLVVWGLAPRDIRAYENEDGTCTSPTPIWDRMIKARAGVFGPIQALSEHSWRDLYFGTELTGDGEPLARRTLSTLGDQIDYGDGQVVEEIPLPQAAQASLRPPEPGSPLILQDDGDDWRATFQICEARLDGIADTIQWLTAQGIDVYVVGMPQGRANSYAGGRDVVQAAFDRIGQTSLAAGAIGYLDVWRTFNKRFVDGGIHLSYDASVEFTEMVVDQLGILGR